VLLVLVAIMIGLWSNRLEYKKNGEKEKAAMKSIPVPWFVLGFLLMCGINTIGIIPEAIANELTLLGIWPCAAAGLKLEVEVEHAKLDHAIYGAIRVFRHFSDDCF
jgi:uncharacterized membrane protein YadS